MPSITASNPDIEAMKAARDSVKKVIGVLQKINGMNATFVNQEDNNPDVLAIFEPYRYCGVYWANRAVLEDDDGQWEFVVNRMMTLEVLCTIRFTPKKV